MPWLYPYTNPPRAAKHAIAEVLPFERMPFMPPGPAYLARAVERPCPLTGAIIEKINVGILGFGVANSKSGRRPALRLLYNLVHLVC
jgi:hypothetical protein